MARRNILDLERKVKIAYQTDKSSPEMYETIYELAKALLVVKGMTFNHQEVDEIGHMLASDFYIKLNHEGLRVTSWTKYIMLRLYDYRSKYLNETSPIELEVKDAVDLSRVQKNLGSGLDSSRRISEFETMDLIKYLPKLYTKMYTRYVRYVEGSYEYNHILMSLMLSTMNNDIVIIGLDRNEYHNYIQFLMILINRKLVNYISNLCGDRLNDRSSVINLIHEHKSFNDE